jgi:hypothetical protein
MILVAPQLSSDESSNGYLFDPMEGVDDVKEGIFSQSATLKA